MEKHKCKLCFRAFPNGRSLGGHMKSHQAKIRLQPKSSSPTTTCRRRRRGPDDDESSSSFSYSDEEDELEVEQEIIKNRAVAEAGGEFGGGGGGDAVYGLRENPRKSFRVADPEFSFAGSSSVVQDRESETESRNPTRRRSKRTRKLGGGDREKGLVVENQGGWIFDSAAAAAEQEPVSSVSDTSPEEDVAMCLVMLSRDVNWKRRFSYKTDEIEGGEEEETGNGGGIKNKKRGEAAASLMAEIEEEEEEEEEDEAMMMRSSRIRGEKKLKCEKCMKQFRSSQALGSHRRICGTGAGGGGMGNNVVVSASASGERVFQCPYCFKVFGSGQALGGHKRSHLTGGGSYYPLPPPAAAAARRPPPPPATTKMNRNYSFLDLNFPAPVEDEEFSVVSDA